MNDHGGDWESAEWTEEVHSALQRFRNRKMGFVFSAAGIVGDLRSELVLGEDARHDQASG